MQRNPSIRQWTLLGLLLIAVSLLGTSFQARAQDNHGPRETFQIMRLLQFMGPPPSPDPPATGAVRLNRTRQELSASVHVTDLKQNSAYTLWVAIFNNPEACLTNPAGPIHCSATDLMAVPNPARGSAFNVGAFVTGAVNGTANTDFRIRSGLPPDGIFILWGKGGLNDNGVTPGIREGNGFGAEVHVVVRTHGSIIPTAITDQLSMLNGGCPPNTCANVESASFPSVGN